MTSTSLHFCHDNIPEFSVLDFTLHGRLVWNYPEVGFLSVITYPCRVCVCFVFENLLDSQGRVVCG